MAQTHGPSLCAVHGALIATQIIFGGGSVVGKLGVATFNPMLFALIRESVAGVLLLCWALYMDGPQRLKRRRDAWHFLLCGFFIFTNQACFIIGDKLAGPVLASAWQPTQPVFTLLIALTLGWERLTVFKALGIVISVCGAAFMVTFGADFSGKGAATLIAGNLLFCGNCLGTSLYVIFCKTMLRRGYPPTTLTAWSYINGAVMMACVACGFNSSCRLVSFLCPPPTDAPALQHCDEYDTSCAAWAVPSSAVMPLAYWIIFNSCAAYWMMTWANKHAQAGFVLAYCALQPLTATVLSLLIIGSGAQTNLTMPGWNALGALPIILGLVLIVRDGKAAHDEAAKQSGLPASLQNLTAHSDPLLVDEGTRCLDGHASRPAGPAS